MRRKPPLQHAEKRLIIASSAACDQFICPGVRQHIALVCIRDRPCRELRNRCKQVFRRKPVCFRPCQHFCRILRAKAFPARGLGQGQRIIAILPEPGKQRFICAPARGDCAARIIGLSAVRYSRSYRIDNHVAGAGVKCKDILRPCCRREHRHVSNAPDILQQNGFIFPAVQKIFREWDKRRALPAERHIRHAKIRNHRHARARCDDGAFADLHRIADWISILS